MKRLSRWQDDTVYKICLNSGGEDAVLIRHWATSKSVDRQRKHCRTPDFTGSGGRRSRIPGVRWMHSTTYQGATNAHEDTMARDPSQNRMTALEKADCPLWFGCGSSRRVASGAMRPCLQLRQAATSRRSRSPSNLNSQGHVRPRSMAGFRRSNCRWHCLNPAIYGHLPEAHRRRSSERSSQIGVVRK